MTSPVGVGCRITSSVGIPSGRAQPLDTLASVSEVAGVMVIDSELSAWPLFWWLPCMQSAKPPSTGLGGGGGGGPQKGLVPNKRFKGGMVPNKSLSSTMPSVHESWTQLQPCHRKPKAFKTLRRLPGGVFGHNIKQLRVSRRVLFRSVFNNCRSP